MRCPTCEMWSDMLPFMLVFEQELLIIICTCYSGGPDEKDGSPLGSLVSGVARSDVCNYDLRHRASEEEMMHLSPSKTENDCKTTVGGASVPGGISTSSVATGSGTIFEDDGVSSSDETVSVVHSGEFEGKEVSQTRDLTQRDHASQQLGPGNGNAGDNTPLGSPYADHTASTAGFI